MKQKLKYFFLGCGLTLLILGIALPVGAQLAAKSIQVYTGVTIYVDESILYPRDAQGNLVEAFLYNGTTYLPVRAVGEALGQVIQWEGSTHSVYIGARSTTTPQVWLKDMDYFYDGNTFYGFTFLNMGDKDNLGNSYTNAITGDFERTYRLGAQYTRMTGTFYQRYDQRSAEEVSTCHIIGDGATLFYGEVTRGADPIAFDLPLEGVLQLEVLLDGTAYNAPNLAALGDCGFYMK